MYQEDENMEKKNEMKPLDEEKLDMVSGGCGPEGIGFDQMSDNRTRLSPNITEDEGSQLNRVKGKFHIMQQSESYQR